MAKVRQQLETQKVKRQTPGQWQLRNGQYVRLSIVYLATAALDKGQRTTANHVGLAVDGQRPADVQSKLMQLRQLQNSDLELLA